MSRRPRDDDRATWRQRQADLREQLALGELDIATAVRRMRALSGLTQAEFAQHRGISLPTLKQIEGGKGNPTVSTLNAIASVFGLQVGFVPLAYAPLPETTAAAGGTEAARRRDPGTTRS